MVDSTTREHCLCPHSDGCGAHRNVNTYLVVSSLLNFSAALVMALTAFVTARRTLGSVSFGLVALSIGAWAGAYSLWRLSDTPAAALWLCRMVMLGAIFVPVTLLHFALVLTGRRRHRVLWVCYSFATLLAVADLTNTFVDSVRTVGGLAYWPKAGPVFPVFLIYFYGCAAAAVALLVSDRAGLCEPKSNPRLVVIALSVGILGGSTNFPLWYGLDIPPVGNGLVFIYLGLLGYAVTKYRLPHLQPDFVKGAAFFGISMAVGLACVGGTLFVRSLTDRAATTNELTARFFFGMLVTALALWAVPVIVSVTEQFLGQSLLKVRHHLQRELKLFLRVIGREKEEPAILQAAAEQLATIFRAKEVLVYFHGELEPGMRLRVNLSGRAAPAGLPDDVPLVRTLAARGVSISAGRLAMTPGRWAEMQSDTLREMGAELAVPMMAQGKLAGVILMDRPEITRDDNETVLSLLEAVGVQLALTINARRLERRANQADKLIALGTLAAGLAHELRNPLTSIHTFVSLVESGVNPGQDPNFRRIVLRDTQRITSIVENVSVFANNADLAMGPVQLDQVLASTLEIARAELVGTSIRTSLQCGVNKPVRGNYGQLQQVFVNLVQNAIQAIGSGAGEIELAAEPIVLSSGEMGARVVVRDTGPGVAPEVLPKIFEPFVTTKATGERSGKRGLGLGLAIVKRIIEAHRGDIRVESEPGRGTRFFVYLPGQPDS